MTDKLPAHEAIVQSIDRSREELEPPKATATLDKQAASRVGGVLLLVVVVVGLGIFVGGGEEKEGPTVVASRAELEDGAAAFDVLPGAPIEEVVFVDERVQSDLRSLRDAEITWLTRGNPPRSLPPCPAGAPYRGLQAWGGPCRDAWSAATAWQIPESSPCRYQVFAVPPDDFRVVAECDADGDGQFETWVSDRTTEPHTVRLNVR